MRFVDTFLYSETAEVGLGGARKSSHRGIPDAVSLWSGIPDERRPVQFFRRAFVSDATRHRGKLWGQYGVLIRQVDLVLKRGKGGTSLRGQARCKEFLSVRCIQVFAAIQHFGMTGSACGGGTRNISSSRFKKGKLLLEHQPKLLGQKFQTVASFLTFHHSFLSLFRMVTLQSG